ncbi:MAG: hypothetical protein K2X82_20595 [Gemmataceae bacterium]|nr:hypothetical protein [Gemmataceae bacterium]
MPTEYPDTRPAGLARSWVVSYNRFAFLVVALREVARKGWPAGCLRELLTEAAADAVDRADHLRALGHPPHREFAGDERELWARTVRYVSGLPVGEPADGADRARAAWDAFAGFAAGLPDAAFAGLTAFQPWVFRPDGPVAPLGQGVVAPAAGQGVGKPLGQEPDEPAVVPAGG